MNSAQDLHHRALAGAVLAEKSVDFSRLTGELRPVQRHDAAEPLVNASGAKEGHSRAAIPRARRTGHPPEFTGEAGDENNHCRGDACVAQHTQIHASFGGSTSRRRLPPNGEFTRLATTRTS